MEQTFGLSFMHATEMAAMAAARSMGQGNHELSDQLAVQTMRDEFNQLAMRGTIVIGEGERDKAPMLYIGEHVGSWEEKEPEVDIAVDPLENTNATANGTSNAIAVIAISEKGGLLHAPDVYMDKIVVGHDAKGVVDIDAPPEENLINIAKALDRRVEDLTVAILDRDRHKELIAAVRACGARIKLIPDGDLSAGIAAAVRGTGVHAVMGIGGAPEGVLAAAALRCLNGEIQARLVALNREQHQRLDKVGISDLQKVYTTHELASGRQIMFSATGVTDGDLLKGVRFFGGGARTETLFMSNLSQKVRLVDTTHVHDHDDISFILK
ncbi:fructose-bisphosphatase, class II [Candidatus Wirthbacteria bacterium CG2_30_54_11]|uniref:Fructose-1,6-bisphosphatase n=1 Tax=Candidatus Wirthbacteria bacterium CG2_30_54_11 TaxID=1817892 RepID=A0A1J5IL70_9BACT|nr:MAG: fructose-bisphosphatase, class II [Candidatus Wirthbacteria bacterium CG2_30_54_11]